MKLGEINKLTTFLKNKGFTVMEVIVAFSLFAIFAAVFLQTQSQNIFDSFRMNEELVLKQLCEGKITELLINPPEFKSSLHEKKETKSFELDNYEGYSYTIEYRQFKTPDLENLMMQSQQEDEDQDETRKKQIEMLKSVFQTVQKKIENVFWQIQVTVTNKETGEAYDLSTWFLDPKAKFNLKIPALNPPPPKAP